MSLTDFWISFNRKLHNHFLGICADENKWRIRFLTHVWVLWNIKIKSSVCLGQIWNFKKIIWCPRFHLNMLVTVLFMSHSDKEGYAQQTRTNLPFPQALAQYFYIVYCLPFWLPIMGTTSLKKKDAWDFPRRIRTDCSFNISVSWEIQRSLSRTLGTP